MLFVPIVFRFAKKHNLYDKPGPRKAHLEPVPRVGGISFVAGTLCMIVFVFFLDNTIAESFRNARMQFITLLSGAGFMYLVGLVDDLHPIRGIVKLLCLVGAASAFCFSGAAISTIQFGSGYTFQTGWAAFPVTVCWIVAITICIGVIDGLDGLAAGIAAMVCGTLVVFSLWTAQAAMAVLMLALLGGITGFLIFNFYPAKIFMGDGGSLFLGFMIGAGSVLCHAKTSTFIGLALPFLVLGMPILDTGLVVAFRGFIERRSLFAPDNKHFHHRLLRQGLKHRSAVIVMYAITAVCASLGIFMLTSEGSVSFELLTAGIVLLLSIFAVLQKGRYRKLFAGLKRNLAIARQVKIQARSFETAQIKMYDTISFDNWWEILCNMGESMGFQSLSLLNRDNGQYQSSCQWSSLRKKTGKNRAVEINLPLEPDDNRECILRARIYVEDYLELSGHQVKLLARLIDEFPLPEDCGYVDNVPSDLSLGAEDSPSSIKKHGQDVRDKTSHGRSHKSFTDSFRNVSSGLRYIFKHHQQKNIGNDLSEHRNIKF